MAGPVVVDGLNEMFRALSKAERDVRLGVRREFRKVAEPIRRDAETLARQEIPRIGRNWYKMRVGVTRKLVYVAPRQRGVKRIDDPHRRGKQFANLLRDRAMDPALARNEGEVMSQVELLFDGIADNFNHGAVSAARIRKAV